jgi:hypothetical protein
MGSGDRWTGNTDDLSDIDYLFVPLVVGLATGTHIFQDLFPKTKIISWSRRAHLPAEAFEAGQPVTLEK